MNFVLILLLNILLLLKNILFSTFVTFVTWLPQGSSVPLPLMTDAEDSVTVQIHGSLDVYCLVISFYIYFHLFL